MSSISFPHFDKCYSSTAFMIYEAIKEKSLPQLTLIFETTTEVTKNQLNKALLTHYPFMFELTPIAFAAYINFSEGINFIAESVSAVFLKQLLKQIDTKGWTTLHHIAIMDDAACYKKVKKLSGINTKTDVTDYYCESPSFMRQCLKDRPKHFTPKTIYVHTGELDERKEEALTLEELINKHKDSITEAPSGFQLIPHCTREYFRKVWIYPNQIFRDVQRLKELDDHLRKIFANECENRLALATVTYDDNKISLNDVVSKKIGLGVETRSDGNEVFEEKELITLYGGEMHYIYTTTSIYEYIISDYFSADGEGRRSFGSSISHSFPNVKWWNAWTILGPIPGMKAIEAIPKNTLLAIDYGPNYFPVSGCFPTELRSMAKLEYRFKNEISSDHQKKTKADRVKRSYINDESSLRGVVLAEKLFFIILNRQNHRIPELFNLASRRDIANALLTQFTAYHRLNPIGFAARQDNDQAVMILFKKAMNFQIAKEMLLQEDKSHWTALHHIALVTNESCYRKIKKVSQIDTKQKTSPNKFYCESPSFLRQCIKENPKRFSAQLNIYVRSGDPENPKEEKLNFSEMISEYGDQFTNKPTYFRSIPFGTRDYFKAVWLNSTYPKRNPVKLPELDQHLCAIYDRMEENGLALTTVTHDDKGNKLPERVKIGLGVTTRHDYFKKDKWVTLYGGEYFYQSKNPSSDYGYLISEDINFSSDAEKYRSFGATLLHSLPNVAWEEIWTIFGPFTGLRAIEDIPERTGITLNYGSGYFKCRKIECIELKPAAIEKFLSENNFETIRSNPYGEVYTLYLKQNHPEIYNKSLKND